MTCKPTNNLRTGADGKVSNRRCHSHALAGSDHRHLDKIRLFARRTTVALVSGSLLLGAFPTVGNAGVMALSGTAKVSPSGAATYTIPLALPPGSAGMTPILSLTYNSQSGNGLLGMGWSLDGISSITRCPRTLAQDGVAGAVKYDANDRFCMDGQRLMVVSGTYGADGAQYRTEIDTFSKVISHGTKGVGPAWFEVHTKSGQIIEYGNGSNSQVVPSGKTAAQTWTTNKVRDLKGNYYTITYDATEHYPTRIDYTGQVGVTDGLYNSVQFSYENRSSSEPTPPFTKRLSSIKTYAWSVLVTDYRLAYSGSTNPTARTKLSSITPCDAKGACLGSTVISYTGLPESNGGFGPATLWVKDTVHFGSNGAAGGYADNTINPRMLVDVFGDGLPGVVGFANWGTVFSPNLGAAYNYQFSFPLTYVSDFSPTQGWANNTAFPRTLIDVNGDGLPDIVGFGSSGVMVSLNLGTGPSPTTGTGGFGPTTAWLSNYFGYSSAAGGWTDDTKTPRVLVDVNGDGRPDIVGFGFGGVWVSINTGKGFNAPTTWITNFGVNQGWTDSNLYPRYLADVNGDGLPDIVGFGPSGVMVSLNTGSSFSAAQNWLSDYTIGNKWANNNTYPRYLIDVNGDGLLDIVGFGPSWTYVSLNTGTFSAGTGFTPIQQAIGNFRISDGYTDNNTFPRMLTDVNGDGLPDIVAFSKTGVVVSLNRGTFKNNGTTFAAPTPWISDYGANQGWANNNVLPRKLVDVNGDGFPDIVAFAPQGVLVSFNKFNQAPDLMSSIEDGLGVKTTFTYVPATNKTVVQKGTGTTIPNVNMVGPMYVASRMDVGSADSLKDVAYSSTYSYSGARAHIGGRGFLGFAQTTVTDLQTGISETTAYRQDFPYIGLVAWTMRKAGSTQIGYIGNTYDVINGQKGTSVSGPSFASAPYRVRLTKSEATGADLNGAVLPKVTTENSYDVYNNATVVVVTTADGNKKTSTNTYTNDETNWILGRLTRTTVTNYSP